MVATGQHTRSAVIAGDYHKCAAVIGIEHIVIGKACIGLRLLGMNKRQLLRVG